MSPSATKTLPAEASLPPEDPRPPWVWPRAAYVHVPFCAYRCDYCDFAIAVGRDALADRYGDAVAAELATLGSPQPVRTLFLGGGTPSQLTARQLERLLGAMLAWLPPRPGPEFTVEANPDSLDADRVAVLADHAVTRISLGAQSFQPELLRVLGRRHRPDEIPRAVARARARGLEVSLDLIFGVPGETLGAWGGDLRDALALEPDHLSTYGLTWEKGTPLWKRQRAGAVAALDEEDERAQYLAAIDTLGEAGFEHYEISNFARPGRRSRHNEVYWANEAYFGFGMGAARYVGGRRELNTRELEGYLRKVLAGEPAAFQAEELAPEARARETLALGLRRRDGVARARFGEQTGFDLDALAGEALGRYAELGLLTDDGQRVRLTRDGLCVADAVVAGVL